MEKACACVYVFAKTNVGTLDAPSSSQSLSDGCLIAKKMVEMTGIHAAEGQSHKLCSYRQNLHCVSLFSLCCHSILLFQNEEQKFYSYDQAYLTALKCLHGSHEPSPLRYVVVVDGGGDDDGDDASDLPSLTYVIHRCHNRVFAAKV